ncbi:methyltransferase domain-containing protein (plasmid) [Burkholderia sp. M6-3]
MRYPRFDAVDAYGGRSCVEFLEKAYSLADVRAIKKRSCDLLRLKHGQYALDLGCGIGFDAQYLAEQVGKNGKVVGVDSSQTMIQHAKRYAAECYPHLMFIQGDAYKLNFPDKHFDCCRVDRLLHILDKPVRVMQEVSRVTRPDGRVVVGEPDWQSLHVSGGDEETTMILLEHAQDSSASSQRIDLRLEIMFEENGLQVETILAEPLEIADVDMAVHLFHFGELASAAVRAGLLSRSNARAWLQSLLDAEQQKQFACCLTGYTVVGLKQRG